MTCRTVTVNESQRFQFINMLLNFGTSSFARLHSKVTRSPLSNASFIVFSSIFIFRLQSYSILGNSTLHIYESSTCPLCLLVPSASFAPCAVTVSETQAVNTVMTNDCLFMSSLFVVGYCFLGYCERGAFTHPSPFSLYSNISSSARYSSLRQCMSATPSLIN